MELWPGGPATLPCQVSIAGTVVTAQFVPAATIAYYTATGQWGALAERLFAVDESIRERLVDPDDDLDGPDFARAALLLAIRLSGAGDGIEAWRVLMHMCGVMIKDWLEIAGRLSAQGVDPQTAQLWQVVAAVRHLIVDGADPEYREWVARVLEYPLPREPSCVPGAGGMDAARSRSVDGFRALMEGMGGLGRGGRRYCGECHCGRYDVYAVASADPGSSPEREDHGRH